MPTPQKQKTIVLNDITRLMSETLNITQKDAKIYAQSFIDIITNEIIDGKKVRIADFFNFYVRCVPARMRRNPGTGETFLKPEYKKLEAKASSSLKKRIL